MTKPKPDHEAIRKAIEDPRNQNPEALRDAARILLEEVERLKATEQERDDWKAEAERLIDRLAELSKVEQERDEAYACIEYGRDAIQAYCDSENEMRQERDRLREALEEIKKWLPDDWRFLSDPRGKIYGIVAAQSLKGGK